MDFRSELPSVGKGQSDARQKEAAQLLRTHPRMIPTIIESATTGQSLPQNKYFPSRFLIPGMYTFHEFTQVLRRRFQLDPADSIVLTVQGTVVPAMEQTMQKIYERYRAEDLFLYVTYTRETVYG